MNFESFNHMHYSNVAYVRRESFMRRVAHSRASSDFSLMNRKLKCKETGEIFTVDYVVEHWYQGWYRVITAYNEKNSHMVRVVANLSSHSEWVKESLEEFIDGYEIIYPDWV